jgi:hypothetical protein
MPKTKLLVKSHAIFGVVQKGDISLMSSPCVKPPSDDSRGYFIRVVRILACCLISESDFVTSVWGGAIAVES